MKNIGWDDAMRILTALIAGALLTWFDVRVAIALALILYATRWP